MRRLGALRSILVFSLTLLLATAAPLGQTASAQEAQGPSFDVDAPILSLRMADLTTDQQRVQMATQLLRARADTKISRSTYKDGVWYFLSNHPDFYGNFFGDPFYATYDVRFSRLVRARQLAGTDVNPQNSFRGSTSFFCHPLWYDPAFGGQCRGMKFAASDFFQIPFFFRSRLATPPVVPIHPLSFSLSYGYGETPSGPQSIDDAPHEPTDVVRPLPASRVDSDAPRITSVDLPDRSTDEETSSARSESRSPEETIQTPDHKPRQVRLPDDLHTSIRETAASLRRTEVELRLQQQIREDYGGRQNLSPQERAELARRFSRTVYSSGRWTGSVSPKDESSVRSEDEHPRYTEVVSSSETDQPARSRPHPSRSGEEDGRDERSELEDSGRDTSSRATDPPERERPKADPKRADDPNEN